MNFDEWYKNYLITAESWNRNLAKKAWGAAIDEAVKVLDGYITITEAEEEDGLHWSRNITSQISDKIKELKND